MASVDHPSGYRRILTKLTNWQKDTRTLRLDPQKLAKRRSKRDQAASAFRSA